MKPIEEVTLLYEITKALNEHLDLKKSLYKVLDILSNLMNMVRGTITILNPVRNEINIEVAHGLNRSAMERVTYKLGEGITPAVSSRPERRWPFQKLARSRFFWTAPAPEKKRRIRIFPLSVFP